MTLIHGSNAKARPVEGDTSSGDKVGDGMFHWKRLFSRLFGLRYQKPPRPICSRGTVAVSEKLLDTKELTAQISAMVAETVVNKLTAIGLTAENIRKLEYLAAAPPFGSVGGGSRVTSLADAVIGQLTAIGLTEENVKKLAALGGGTPLALGEGSQAAWQPLHSDDTEDLAFPSSSFTEDPFDSSTWATERNRSRGSLRSSRMSTGRLECPAEGPLLSESSQSAKSSHPPQAKLHPFNTLPGLYDSPIQISRRRKRDAVSEVITPREELCPRPKKMRRQDEVDYATDQFSTDTDMDTHLRGSGSEKLSQRWRADGESQVKSLFADPTKCTIETWFQSSHTSAHELVRGGDADHLGCALPFIQDPVSVAKPEPTAKQGVEVGGRSNALPRIDKSHNENLPNHLSDSRAAPLTPTKPPLSPSFRLGSSLQRASLSRQGKASRLRRTKLLNKYMPILRDKCLSHFVLGEELVPDHFPSCQYLPSQSVAQGNYMAFRQSFNFSTKFEYCYSCGAPQDQQNNGECPEFHIHLRFGKCGYNHVLFRTAFCIWQSPNLRAEMIRDLAITVPLTSQEDFVEWAKEIKATEGKYHNCSEAFLWFCGQLERRRPSFFM